MENMAPLRSSTSHGGSGDFLVCLSSDDSSHLVKHKQIQLVGLQILLVHLLQLVLNLKHLLQLQ